MTARNLAEERNQLKQFELIAAGHLRSGNRELATRFNDLIRAYNNPKNYGTNKAAVRDEHPLGAGPGLSTQCCRAPSGDI